MVRLQADIHISKAYRLLTVTGSEAPSVLGLHRPVKRQFWGRKSFIRACHILLRRLNPWHAGTILSFFKCPKPYLGCQQIVQ